MEPQRSESIVTKTWTDGAISVYVVRIGTESKDTPQHTWGPLRSSVQPQRNDAQVVPEASFWPLLTDVCCAHQAAAGAWRTPRSSLESWGSL